MYREDVQTVLDLIAGWVRINFADMPKDKDMEPLRDDLREFVESHPDVTKTMARNYRRRDHD